MKAIAGERAVRGIDLRELARRCRILDSAVLPPTQLEAWLLAEGYARLDADGLLVPTERVLAVDWSALRELDD